NYETWPTKPTANKRWQQKRAPNLQQFLTSPLKVREWPSRVPTTRTVPSSHLKNEDHPRPTENGTLTSAPVLKREITAGIDSVDDKTHLDATGRNPGTIQDLNRVDGTGHGTRKPHQEAQEKVCGNLVESPRESDNHTLEQPAPETDERTHRDRTESQSVNSCESQWQTTDTAPNVLSDDTRSKPRPSSSSTASSKDQDPFLCSLQAWDSDAGPLQIRTAIGVQDTSVSDAVLVLWAVNSAISLKLFKALKQRHSNLPHVTKHSHFPLSPSSTATATSKLTTCPEQVTIVHQGPADTATMEEPYAGFNAQIQQILREADALHNEADRQGLKEVLHKLWLNQHPHGAHPNKPTFVRQYKIPIASYEPVQEIIDSMLKKEIIRPCKSMYSAPIWPVLKPNGKWRPTVNYRKLNQQVPLSRWPMTQLDQELPKIKVSTILSTLDVASGFWTIPVHPDDQHKLAFTCGNRQFAFMRCPFSYANSPAELNIFLNKACPDARARGNIIYIDDLLLKTVNVADHLEEINHVLNQLTTAGAKIALHKGQSCKKEGIEPQSSRTQAIQNIKTPTNLSELRSFLGICDCSRHQLKQWLCSAPCLAYLDPGKEFYLEAGFSKQCLSAGLYQLHDKDKRVVAYTTKMLLPPECKYSDCEKAIQRFSNYIGVHQPVTFLNSQEIQDGVVTNACIATWLMTLQDRDVEARYAQNHKSSLGDGLAACQNCSNDTLYTSEGPKESQPQLTNHRYFDENACEGMPTVYVDGCSYNHQGNLKAGADVVYLNNSTWIAAILITLQLAASHNSKELLICTDSNYACLSFTCHLAGMRCHCHKAQHDRLLEKDLNDQTDALAKAGALHGEPWKLQALPPSPAVTVVTRRQHAPAAPASSQIELSTQFHTADLLTLQSLDPALRTIAPHISDPFSNPISTSDLAASSDFRTLHSIKHMLHLHDGILTYVAEPHTVPRLVVPYCQRGTMLFHAHDAPCAGHHGAKATWLPVVLPVSTSKPKPPSTTTVERNDLPMDLCRGQPEVTGSEGQFGSGNPLHSRGDTGSVETPGHHLITSGQYPVRNDDGATNDATITPAVMNLVTAYTTHQYLEELHQHPRMTFSFAQQQLQKSAEDRKAYYNQKASYQELSVGDKVWYYSFAQPRQNTPHRLSKKFHPTGRGPTRLWTNFRLLPTESESEKGAASQSSDG
ncbi:hypothetical protein M9458_056922, partial [Cirrhinus mrigala]